MTPARRARLSAGFTLPQAAKRARISPEYLRAVEQRGAPYHLARRLAGIYGVPIDTFLYGSTTHVSNRRRNREGTSKRGTGNR